MQYFTDEDLNTSASSSAVQLEPPALDGPYGQVLREFADLLTLKHEGIEASVKVGFRPDLLYLMLAPKYRRHEASIMRSYYVRGTEALSGARETERLSNPQALKEDILKFYRDPEFQWSIQELTKLSREDLVGSLRQRGLDQFYSGDLLLDVKNAQHRLLATAQPGLLVQLNAQLRDPDAHPSAEKHRYFVCNGYGLRVREISRQPEDDGLVAITGEAMPPGVLR